MRICTVVGARPQFIKAAVVSHALVRAGIEEVMIHTGQHYDRQMSQVFFDELGIAAPWINLGVGSGRHGEQTGEIMKRLDAALEDQLFDWMLVYGDTNSTMAAALVAAKRQIPVAHVEAGLRSFNRRMPEEINRVVTDHLSRLQFCPTETAVANLEREGIKDGVVLSGDVMLDATNFFFSRACETCDLSSLVPDGIDDFFLATIHRAENTDHPGRLSGIMQGLEKLNTAVLLPLHPRTRPRLAGIPIAPNIHVMEPLGYLAMLRLTKAARRVLTDSGGLQKEAYWLGTPCVTLREETEWVETLDRGWNQLVGADPEAIARAVHEEPNGARRPFGEAPSGSASQLIAASLLTETG